MNHAASTATRSAPAAPPPHRRVHPAAVLLLMAASLLATLAVVEVALHIAGFSYELRLHMVESTAPAPDETRQDYVVDRDLAWVPKDYPETLRRALAEHPDLVFMGDSCTQLGWYDEYVVSFAQYTWPGVRLRTANLGCAGWTSHQGLRQMQRDVTRIRPRLACIYYGWNDHWLSIGVDDAEVERLNDSLLYRLRALKLAQLVTRAWVGYRLRRADQHPVRVPPEQFRRNLEEMVGAARAAGITPILLTAPTAHRLGREPEYLAGRWIAHLEDLVPLHRRYVEIVREVARRQWVVLCDAAAEFDALPQDMVRDELFMADGIHFTDEGNKALAAAIIECLRQNDLVDGGRPPRD